MRKHGKPSAIGFVDPSGKVRVSLQGVAGFHIGKLLHCCSQCLEGFGDHAGAGGGTIKTGMWQTFVTTFSKAIDEQKKNKPQALECLIDGMLGLAERLQHFEPTGRGNPACTWLLKDVCIVERKDLKGGVIRLRLSDGHRYVPVIVFGIAILSDFLQLGQVVSVLGQLKMDDWRGNGAIQFVIDDELVE